MQASFFRMFQSEPAVIENPNRLQQKIDYRKILTKIEELRALEKTLDKDAKKMGGESNDRAKQIIISSLLSDVDNKIKLYNEAKSDLSDFAKETQDTIKLTIELSRLIKDLLEEHNVIINTHRHKTAHELGRGALDSMPFTVAAAAGSVAELTFLPAMAAVSAGCLVSEVGKKHFGVSTAATHSSILLTELTEILDRTAQNQALSLRLRKPEEYKKLACPHEYICPITLDIMIDPHSLNLPGEGNSYEKEAILKHLRDKKNSPLVPSIKMRDDQKPEEVITPNRNLKKLIEDYRIIHPEAKPAVTEEVKQENASPRARN